MQLNSVLTLLGILSPLEVANCCNFDLVDGYPSKCVQSDYRLCDILKEKLNLNANSLLDASTLIQSIELKARKSYIMRAKICSQQQN